MAGLYRVLDFAKLHFVSVIIWDIDGTITDPDGKVNNEIAAKIMHLALKGVYQIFITGRDAQWIIDNVIKPMVNFYIFPRIHDNLIFFAEVGCIMLTVDSKGNVTKTVHPAVENHPLRCNTNGIRDVLKQLAYCPKQEQKHQAGQVYDSTQYKIIYDANKADWLFPRSEPEPLFPFHIWSIYKEVFATLENLRDENGKPMYFVQPPWASKLQKAIQEAGFSNDIDVEIVSTALNIVPKINGVRLGKSWAAGVSLLYLWKEKLGKSLTLDEIINKAIAFGDGTADFDFAIPFFEPAVAQGLECKTIQIVFVGEEEDIPSDKILKNNMIISATGGGDLVFSGKKQVIELHPIKGAMVSSAVLDFLKQWDYFRSF